MPERSAAADRMDNLYLVTFGQRVAGVQAARNNLVIHFHCDAALAITGLLEQLGDGRGGGAVARTAIERDVHPPIVAADDLSALFPDRKRPGMAGPFGR